MRDLFFLKNIFSQSIFLLMSQGLNFVYPLIFTPFLVRELGLTGFGELSFCIAVATYTAIIISFGVDLRGAGEVAISPRENIFSVFLKVYFPRVYIFLLLCFFYAISYFLVGEDSFKIAAILFYAGSLSLIPLWFFQGIQRLSFAVAINGVLKLLGLYFLTNCEKLSPVTVVFYLSLPSYVAIFVLIIYIYFNFNHNRDQFSFLDFKGCVDELIKSVNFFKIAFMSGAISAAGPFWMGFFYSGPEVGVYAILDRIYRVTSSLFQVFSQVCYPLVVKAWFNEKGSDKWKTIFLFLISIICVILFLFLFFDTFIVNYFQLPISYLNYYYTILFWFSIAAINNILGVQYFTALGKISVYSKSFLISSCFSIILCLVLTPTLSIQGVVASLLIGESTLLLCLVFAFKKSWLSLMIKS